MRPEEAFEFDSVAYAERIAKHDTKDLQQQEVTKTRQILSSSVSYGSGIATTVATGGAAVLLPLYSGRKWDIAEKKLEIIQAELKKRGVALHKVDGNDAAVGYTGGLLAEDVGGDIDNDVVSDAIAAGAIQHVVAQTVAGDITEAVFEEITDETPEKDCPRLKKKKYQRLRCDECSVYFDTFFTEYYHCCQCNNDEYDICTECTAKKKHMSGHTLHRMEPPNPTIHSSLRGIMGITVLCNECKSRLKNVDIYSCDECLGDYDICLKCYSQGKGCKKHTNSDPLYREHVGD